MEKKKKGPNIYSYFVDNDNITLYFLLFFISISKDLCHWY